MRKAKRSSTYQAQDKGDRRTVTVIERDDAVSARKLTQLVTGVSRVSVEDRHEILDALCSFSNETEVNYEHPELIEKAFLLMVEEIHKGGGLDRMAYFYTRLGVLLDGVGPEPEPKKGGES